MAWDVSSWFPYGKEKGAGILRLHDVAASLIESCCENLRLFSCLIDTLSFEPFVMSHAFEEDDGCKDE